MTGSILLLSANDLGRVEDIARELSKYGLGIFAPHAHGADGNIAALPLGVVAYENNLNVSFVAAGSVPDDATAVGWRWIDGKLEVCAHCCGRV